VSSGLWAGCRVGGKDGEFVLKGESVILEVLAPQSVACFPMRYAVYVVGDINGTALMLSAGEDRFP